MTTWAEWLGSSDRPIVVAPDSFKGTLSAQEVSQTMKEVLSEELEHSPKRPQVITFPLADGGEGSLASVLEARPDLAEIHLVVPDPLGRPRKAVLGWESRNQRAVIESAQAIGLDYAPEEERDLWAANSRGLGSLILAALDLGAREITLFLGGSGTNDAGAGMLAELGARFLAQDGTELSASPKALLSVYSADLSGLDPRIATTSFIVAVDVTSPLLGPTGATAVFAPQKGATSGDLPGLEEAIERLSSCVVASQPNDYRGEPGAGAAGGIGWATLQVLGGAPRSGFRLISELVGLRSALAQAQLVITGEGRVDHQSTRGKVVGEVISLAQLEGVSAVVIAGSKGPGWEQLLDSGAARVVCVEDQQGDPDLGIPAISATSMGSERELLAEAVRVWLQTQV